MGKGDILLIGGLIAGVYFLTRQNTNPSDSGSAISSTPASAPTTAPTITGYEVTETNVKSVPIVGKTISGSVSVPTAGQLSAIQATATANPTKTIYYPSVGVVTAGGLGYSTNNPAAYISKSTAAAAKTTAAAPKLAVSTSVGSFGKVSFG